MTDPSNPHAFPRGDMGQHGMTLRDWFAGQALAAMRLKDYGDYTVVDHQTRRPHRERTWTADAAYDYADAMMAARKRGDDQ